MIFFTWPNLYLNIVWRFGPQFFCEETSWQYSNLSVKYGFLYCFCSWNLVIYLILYCLAARITTSSAPSTQFLPLYHRLLDIFCTLLFYQKLFKFEIKIPFLSFKILCIWCKSTPCLRSQRFVIGKRLLINLFQKPIPKIIHCGYNPAQFLFTCLVLLNTWKFLNFGLPPK